MCSLRSILNSFIVLMLMNGIFVNPANAEIIKDGIVVKAGLMKKVSDQKYIVYKETRHIPHITEKMDPAFFFGYTLHSKNDVLFYHYAVLEAPSGGDFTGDFVGENREAEGKTIVTTKKVLNKHYGYNWYMLDDKDPSGLYIIKIYINDKLLTTIDFNILPPAKQTNGDRHD